MFPIAKNLGIHDIHYSMVVVTAMNVGLMAPPIGIGFYIACKIGNVSPDEAMAPSGPISALSSSVFSTSHDPGAIDRLSLELNAKSACCCHRAACWDEHRVRGSSCVLFLRS
jgi:hypothetical protein